MARKPQIQSPQELLLQFSQALRNTATAPTIVAYKPLPHQEKFHNSTAKGKLFIGGNRSGKTVGGGAETVKWLTGRHDRKDIPKPPVRGRAIGVDFIDGIDKIIIPEIKKWLPPSYLKNSSWEDSYNSKTRTLNLTNGSFLEFMSYEQLVEKFAGTSRHFVWFDEEPPEDVFNENMLRLADVDGSWWITMTPLIEMSWTFDRLYEPWTQGTRGYVDVFEVGTQENTYVTASALERVLYGISKEEREARLKGTYIKHTGLVYKGSFKPDVNILEDIIASDYWPLYHRKWGHFCMLDHGYRNPTAILFACYDPEGRIVIYDEIYQSEKLISENADDYLRKLEQLKINPEYIVGDPTIASTDPITGTSIHIEYAEKGVHISLGNNDVRGGIARVQHRFAENLLFVTRRCEKLLWEINRYRWDKYASAKIATRRSNKETPVKKDDHALDALRYGIVSRPALKGEIDMPVGNVLNLPTALRNPDIDWIKMTQDHSFNESMYDEQLGTNW